MESARQESSGIHMYLLTAYFLIARKFSLSVVLFGVILIILGATVIRQYHEVFAGMFGVWGVTMIVLGLLAYVLLWANKRYMERVAS